MVQQIGVDVSEGRDSQVSVEAPSGGESGDSASQGLESSISNVQQTEDTSGVGDNPAWGGIREKLGDALYHSIKDDLSAFDKNAQKRITELNAKASRFSPYEDILTEDVTPELTQKALQLARWADTDPAALYENLGKFLQENGRLPQTQQEMDEVQEESDEFGDFEQGGDPRVSQLEAQIQQMQAAMAQAVQEQELKQYTEQTYSAVSAELEELKQAHPYLDSQALGMVIQQAKALHASTGKMPKLADVAQPLLQYRESLLRAPRANDSAPRLPGSGGGMPSAGKPLSQYTKGDDIDAMAALLSQNKNR